MKTSEDGLQRLEDYEGIRYVAYKCSAGIWTIGVGHTGPEVVEGLRATPEQVDAWLREDVVEAEDAINRLVKVPLKQNQFDALVSFVYNVGAGAFSKSTMLRKLNAGDYAGAANEFPRWINAGGKPVEGLRRRREAERKHFLA